MSLGFNPTHEELRAALNGNDPAAFCVAVADLGQSVATCEVRLIEAAQKMKDATEQHRQCEKRLSDARGRLAAAMTRVALK